MQDRIKRALHGDASAMKELFEANWRDVAALCRTSILNEEEANQTLERAFSDAWMSLQSCSFDSEDAFTKYLIKHTAILCRRKFQKNGAKSLPVPANKQFQINGKITVPHEDSSVTEILSASMPGIQRFLFAMNCVSGMDAKAIASVTGYKDSVLNSALLAQTQNLERLLAQNEYKTGLPTDLESEIQRYKDNLYLSEECKSSILHRIELVTAPVRKKEQRKKLYIGVVIAVIVLIICVCCVVFSGGSQDEEIIAETTDEIIAEEETEPKEELDADSEETDTSQTDEVQAQAVYYADIEIEDYGTITVQLDSDAAPRTVENFISLAQSGFYEGLTFHRIMDGFMMQGGDPSGDGTGGSENTIVGEFSENGYDNPISHTRGTISMARSSDYNSASSQFFIVQSDSTFLDGEYAAFGYVTEGMDIVDTICETAEPTDDNGTIPTENQPVIATITIREAAPETDESTGDEG